MCPRNDKTWWQEPCYFTFVRAPTAINRNSRNNPKTMVSMTDHAMIFVRASERGKVPDNFSYPLEVQKYFEQSSSGAHEYGQMANLFLHYRPPTKSQRLKDNMGVMVRKCAERGVDQVEWLVTMFTKEGDLVMDMQAGTASMGLACIKLNRRYFGVEEDQTVYELAHFRMARMKKLVDLNAIDKRQPGVPRSLCDSVHGAALVLPASNLPQRLSTQIDENFGTFVSEEVEQRLLGSKQLAGSLFAVRRSMLTSNQPVGGLSGPISLGEGVVYTGEESLAEGCPLPIFAWGRVSLVSEIQGCPRHTILFPGSMQLTYPYSFMAIWMHEKCPAAKLNDARGTGLDYNVIFRMRRDVRSLVEGEVYAPHLLMQAFAIKTIEPQEELLVNYGEEWWKEAPVIASGKSKEEEEEDEECEESEEDAHGEREEQKASRGDKPIRPEKYIHCTQITLDKAIKTMAKLGHEKRRKAKEHIAFLESCMKYDSLLKRWNQENGHEQDSEYTQGTESDKSDSESPQREKKKQRNKKSSSQRKKTRKAVSEEDD